MGRERFGMKYNLGCGNNYLYGWVNVDQFPHMKPDMVMDLETFPWPIEDNSAEEILLSHVLEHLGGNSSVFLNVMKELYRICKPGARVVIRVPDPRHDDFLSDPTHQRPIIPGLFQTFDLMLNEIWVSRGLPGTPLGKYLGIDFVTSSVTNYIDPEWANQSAAGHSDEAGLAFAQRSYNNVLQWSEIVLTAQKPFSPGRSLQRFDVLVINRWAGLGDVLMALSAAAAIKAATGMPIFLYTSPGLASFARLSPVIDKVCCDVAEVQSELAKAGLTNPLIADWSAARFGISRFHQVDAYLMSLGLGLPDATKGLQIDVPQDKKNQKIRDFLSPLSATSAKIVLHPGATDPNRTWPQTFWTELVNRLVAVGHSVIVVGVSNSADRRSVVPIDHSAVLDLTDQLDTVDTLLLLRTCDVLISNDSGPIQLAGASDIGIVGLYSVAGGDCRLPYRSGTTSYKAVAIAPECPFHPCYPKINDAALLAKFSAAKGITDQNGSTLFGLWCVNDRPFSCTQEIATMDKVLSGVARLLKGSL